MSWLNDEEGRGACCPRAGKVAGYNISQYSNASRQDHVNEVFSLFPRFDDLGSIYAIAPHDVAENDLVAFRRNTDIRLQPLACKLCSMFEGLMTVIDVSDNLDAKGANRRLTVSAGAEKQDKYAFTAEVSSSGCERSTVAAICRTDRRELRQFPVILTTQQHASSIAPGFVEASTLEMMAMRKTTTYFPEVRERAVRMVLEHLNAYSSEWAAIKAMAPKIGCAAQRLHGWIRRHQTDVGQRPGPTTEERERIKALNGRTASCPKPTRFCV